jgi:hypothetical protein
MNLKYPLPDVTLRQVGSPRKVKNPAYSGENCQVNPREYAMQMQGVGSFYACNGNEVEFAAEPGADNDWVSLSLNSQVLVALLHQRKIINFHASSFIHNDRGIMILGETGAGKSSMTASFTLNGAGFLSDDLTPVIFKESKPYIWPLFRAIKLREHTVGQLNIGPQKLKEAEAGTGKQYLNVEQAGVMNFPLHTVLKIEIGNNIAPEFCIPSPVDKFSLLRSEICLWELLSGMPETEVEYLQQILQIVQQVNIVRVIRPSEIDIIALHEAIEKFLNSR